MQHEYDHRALTNDTSKTNCCGICPIEDLHKEAQYYYGLAEQFREIGEQTYSSHWIDAAQEERLKGLKIDPYITDAEIYLFTQQNLLG